MRFGIDFGTTRTVIAVADRGNYPVIDVEDAVGDLHDYVPTVVAVAHGELVAGWDALAPEAPLSSRLRSFKRLLASPDATAETPVAVGTETFALGDVLDVFARYVADRLRQHPMVESQPGTPLEAIVGVPANAHSAQRLLTLDAFSRAGIRVIALVNEPSAAAFEYTHRHPRGINSRRTSVVVYDLGGGTFDASLVRITGTSHEVVRSLGVSRLGGDDFDEVLADLALAAAGREDDVFGDRARQRLLDEARTAKERLAPQSRRLILELGEDDVTVPVDDFYTASTPLVIESIEAMRPLIGETEPGTLADTDIAGIYLVGGASGLPLVPRLLREEFGRRVHRSPYPAASTAIGLAIAADPTSAFHLRDLVSRGIGVFRELDEGERVSFDALLAPGEIADAEGRVSVTRRYRAAHNIGCFRYVEFSARAVDDDVARGSAHTRDGVEITGEITPLVSIDVAFDPKLRDLDDLGDVPVERRGTGPEVVETVSVDANGIASVRIELPEDGYVIERTVERG